MRWEDERYVRVYTRDTVDWLGLSWQARSLFVLLLRKVDRAGLLDLGRGGVRGLAALVAMPLDVVEEHLPLLLEDGCVEQHGNSLVVPNFIEAQEATKSPSARQAESRVKRRDMVRAGLDPHQRETVIYFLQSEHGGPIKIGRADDLAKRLVGLQTSRPDRLVVLAAAPGTVAQEKVLHNRFARCREKGEWFSAIPELTDLIQDVAARGSSAFAVTAGDGSQSATGHETKPVTPSLAVPSRAVPEKKLPAEPVLPLGIPALTHPQASPSADDVLRLWNETAERAHLRRCRGSDKIRKTIRTRLKAAGWFDAFRSALAYVEGSDWTRGQNERGWVADLDWLLRDGNAEKYADRPPDTKRRKETAEDAAVRTALKECDDYYAGRSSGYLAGRGGGPGDEGDSSGAPPLPALPDDGASLLSVLGEIVGPGRQSGELQDKAHVESGPKPR